MKKPSTQIDDLLGYQTRSQLRAALFGSDMAVTNPMVGKLVAHATGLEQPLVPFRLGIIHTYTSNLLDPWLNLAAAVQGLALSMIVRKIPNVLPKFEDMLDHAITLAEHDINDVDCELKLDFKVLVPNQSKGESAMFMNFIEIGHNHLLKHPICESFLYLKWLKARKFFFISLI